MPDQGADVRVAGKGPPASRNQIQKAAKSMTSSRTLSRRSLELRRLASSPPIRTNLRVNYYPAHGRFPGCLGKPNSPFTLCQSSNMKTFETIERGSAKCPENTPQNDTAEHGVFWARAINPDAQTRRRAVPSTNHTTTTTIPDHDHKSGACRDRRTLCPPPPRPRRGGVTVRGFTAWKSVSLS